MAPINPTLSPSTCSRSTSRKPPGCAHGYLQDSREILARQSSLIGRWRVDCQVLRNLCKLSRTRGFRKSQAAGALCPLPLYSERSRVGLPFRFAGSSGGLQSGVEGNPDRLSGRAFGGVRRLRLDALGPALQPGVRVPLGRAIRPNAAKSSPLDCGSSLPCGHDTRHRDDDLSPRILPGDRLDAQPQRHHVLTRQAGRDYRHNRQRDFAGYLGLGSGHPRLHSAWTLDNNDARLWKAWGAWVLRFSVHIQAVRSRGLHYVVRVHLSLVAGRRRSGRKIILQGRRRQHCHVRGGARADQRPCRERHVR